MNCLLLFFTSLDHSMVECIESNSGSLESGKKQLNWTRETPEKNKIKTFIFKCFLLHLTGFDQ